MNIGQHSNRADGNQVDGLLRFHHPRSMPEPGMPRPHAPTHQLSAGGTYFVTASTYLKAHHFRGADRLGVLHRGLLTVARDYGWLFEAWPCSRIITTSWPIRLPTRPMLPTFPRC